MPALIVVVEQNEQVERTERGEFERGLVHEHTAAMDGRTDRIRRDEQYAELLGVARECLRNDRGNSRPAAGGKLRCRR